MALFLALLLPLAVVALGLGVLLGGKIGQVLLIVGTVLAGFSALLVVVGV